MVHVNRQHCNKHHANFTFLYRILGRIIRIDYAKDENFNEVSDLKLHSELLPFININKVKNVMKLKHSCLHYLDDM